MNRDASNHPKRNKVPASMLQSWIAMELNDSLQPGRSQLQAVGKKACSQTRQVEPSNNLPHLKVVLTSTQNLM